MLGRLMKYELKATGRIFLPLYAALLVLAAVTKLMSVFSESSYNVPGIISAILFAMLLVGMFVMTFVVMIQRFCKNLLSDEGYLMFTLPVETWKHITSKLLVSVIWGLGSIAATILSIIILAFEEIFREGLLADFFWNMSQFFNMFGSTSGFAVLELILAAITVMVFGVLIIYASVALGHLVNQHRTLASIGAVLALNAITQILFYFATTIPKIDGMEQFMESLDVSLHYTVSLFHWVMWFTIVFFALLSAGCFFTTNHILKKRLNLE